MDGLPDVWLAGEAMIELRPEGAGHLAVDVAGDTLNTAIYMSRLLPTPGRAAYLTALGQDEMSDRILAALAREGLSDRYVERRPDRLPGLYLINTDAAGERSFRYWRGESAARTMLDPAHEARLEADIGACRLFYFSGISLAILEPARRERLIGLARAAAGRGAIVAFDSNYRPALWQSREEARSWLAKALGAVTTALVSRDDEAALWDSRDVPAIVARIAGLGCGEIVVKDGSEPCTIAWDCRTETVPAGGGVRVVDTTAAGDSFNAAYLAARLAGRDRADAARAGHRLAGIVVGHPGAICPRSAMPAHAPE